jgi:hypothetical protein
MYRARPMFLRNLIQSETLESPGRFGLVETSIGAA